MKVSVKDSGACRKVITIEVPAEKITEERNETLKAYAKYANIPGFRKGKAPKNIIAKKFAEEIEKELQERVLPRCYHEALAETELTVENIIEVSETEIEDGKPLTFDVTVDVAPEFELPKYTEIPVAEEKQDVTDELIQTQVDAILDQHATFEDAEKAVEANDMAELTYEATTDGKPLQEVIPEAKGIGSGAGYWVSADEFAFIPGMGEAIIGLSKGDKKEIEIEFPEGFMVKELAGVKALYSVEVTGVRGRQRPEVDEELCKKLMVESEKDLRSKISEHLEYQLENEALNQKHTQIVKYLIEKTEIELPESVLEQQTRNMVYDISRRRLMAGVTQEMLTEQQEEIREEAKERAIENTKLRYIGLAIADEQELMSSPSEVDEEIATMAIRQRKDARELRKEMEKNGSLDSVADQIRFNKALDYMLENAKIN